MASPLRICLIIPAHNRQAYTQTILAQLQTQIPPVVAAAAGAIAIQTVVVDDGSTDGTATLLQTQFPQVECLAGDGTLWWTGAIAWGMQHAVDRHQADYCVWLNDDITLSPHFIPQVVASCQRYAQQRVVLGGIVLAADWPDWVVFSGIVADRALRQRADLPGDRDLEASTLNGNIVILPSTVLTDVGLPDVARFRHYGGDYDYIGRAKQAGYRILLSGQLWATTDYQLRDVIRYMPLWMRWYLYPDWPDRQQVWRDLLSRKSAYNVHHMVNSMYRDRPTVFWGHYVTFFLKKVAILLGTDYLPPQQVRDRLMAYFQAENLPAEYVQTLMQRRFGPVSWPPS